MTLPIAEGILFKACSITGIYPETLRARGRVKVLARTRQAVMYAIKQRTDWSYPQIARFVGVKDHTTVIHGIRVVPEYIRLEPDYREFVNQLMNAEEVLPLGTREALVKAGVPSMVPNSNGDLRRPKTACAPPVKRFNIEAMMEAKKPKPKPIREFLEYQGDRCVVVNEDGFDQNELAAESNLIAGSAMLAKALHKALAARLQA